MPNIKSVMKDVKKSRQNRLRNLATKSKIKTFVKKSKSMIDEGSSEVAQIVSQTVSIIDKAAEKGIIHKNAAARRKSRLMKKANKASA
ncbi:MAG: 30S ribosomal protein S20 [Armatimonadota bacterium]